MSLNFHWPKKNSNCGCGCAAPSSAPALSCCGLSGLDLHITAGGPAATALGFTHPGFDTILAKWSGGNTNNLWSGSFVDANNSRKTYTINMQCLQYDSPQPPCTGLNIYHFFFEYDFSLCGLDPITFCSDGTLRAGSVAGGTVTVQCSPFLMLFSGIDTCTGQGITFTYTL